MTDEGFIVPPGFKEDLMQTLREHFAAVDAWEEFHFGPPKPPTRRQRFRWWRSRQREHLADLAYRLIAGHDVPEPE